MSFEIWLAFVAASSILLIIPGPTILAMISYSVSHGRAAKLPLVLAVALGGSTALLVSLLGLWALLAASAFWFSVIKIISGLYLLYLGIGLLRSGMTLITLAELTPAAAMGSRWRLSMPRFMPCLPARRGGFWHSGARSAQRRFNSTGGSLLSVAGVWALFARQPT